MVDEQEKKDWKDIIDVDYETDYQFKTLYGLTFVFKRRFLQVKGMVISGSIAPEAIIYQQDGEFYLAPLKDGCDRKGICEEYRRKSVQ